MSKRKGMKAEKKYERHLQYQLTLDGELIEKKLVTRAMPKTLRQPLQSNIIHSCFNCLRLESYGGCTFNCGYCFAKDKQMSLMAFAYDDFDPNAVRPGEISQVLTLMVKALDGKGRSQNVTINALRKRVPIHMSVLSDPFQPAERKYKASLKMLSVIKHFDYPLIISTKGVLQTKDPWWSAITSLEKVIMQTSVVCTDETLSNKLEAAPAPLDRLNMLKTFGDAGYRTVARISPIIPEITEPVIYKTVDDIAKFNIDVISLEHLLLSGNKVILKWYMDAFGVDMKRYFESKEFVRAEGAQRWLAPPELRELMLGVKEHANSYGMKVVYDAPAYFYLHGDMYHCCGSDGAKGFSNDQLNNVNFRGIASDIKASGQLTYGDWLKKRQGEFLGNKHRKEIEKTWNSIWANILHIIPISEDERGLMVYRYEPNLDEAINAWRHIYFKASVKPKKVKGKLCK